MNGIHALYVIAAIAALDIIAITLLAAIGATIPAELATALTLIVGAVTGGTAVKGADLIAEQKAKHQRALWSGDTTGDAP